jgi:hypothetical protein
MRRACSIAVLVLLTVAAVAVPARAQGPVEARIQINTSRQLGTHRTSGDLLLYTPDPVQMGSTISHWDTSAFPNLLMEPAINADLPFLGLDVTPGAMEDMGWPLTSQGGNPVQLHVFDLDPPGTGFTDPTPFPGAPGNPATTLGEARVNLFNAVLGTWGSVLSSDVPVDVLVTWTPLPCSSSGAVLAAAGPLFVFADDKGAFPFNDTWYSSPLAEALVGQDLTGAPADNGGDVIVFMNSSIDQECLGPGTSLYYGIDDNAPSNQLEVAPVVLHELGHGLGFSSTTDAATGEEFQGLPGIYDQFIFDEQTHQARPAMTDAQRQASAVDFRDVTWTGARANQMAHAYLSYGVPELQISSPAAVAGSYEIGQAAFGGDIPAGGLAGQIACMVDAPDLPAASSLVDRTIFDGCSPAENAGQVAGKIALIDRGQCSFVAKARNAQAAGAVGAIIVNNAGNSAPGLGGTAADVTIPVISVGSGDGNRIREAACERSAALLHDRFQVTVRFMTEPIGLPPKMGNGKAVKITDNAAWFYFNRSDNPQLLVKIVNGCGLADNPAYWVLSGGVTNQEVWITVNDTETGASKTYHNRAGVPFETTLDTQAFATCP